MVILVNIVGCMICVFFVKSDSFGVYWNMLFVRCDKGWQLFVVNFEFLFRFFLFYIGEMIEVEIFVEYVFFYIWVDVDVCFIVICDILFCVVEWVGIELILVVNQWICILFLCWLCLIQVLQGLDVVDSVIVEWVVVGDLVVIQDILLVVLVLEKNVVVLNLCGQLYILNNMVEWLLMCNFMEELCGVGIQIGGLLFLGFCDWQLFVVELDCWLV